MKIVLEWIKKLLRRSGREAPPRGSLEPLSEEADNPAHGLETDNQTLAQPHAGGAGPDSPGRLAAEGSAEHGVRGRAGGSAHPGAGTRPPRAATRYLNTALGVLSYAELAPHLATRVQTLQSAIAAGEYDRRTLDENLLLELHRRICADLIPDIAGRWRTRDVVVGDHEPPAYPLVPQRMREYALDLQTRLASLPQEPDDLWLETLAFAEGRLLSIHPFADFNGRVTRVFIDLLTRVLKLPDVDPTPDPGEPTAHYLAALRAADRNDWRPLMDIWRRRIEEALP
jgi:CRISPR-associated endonuclease/helicase Cas3